MIKGIRKTFIENIDTLAWMDKVTKDAAKDKVRERLEIPLNFLNFECQ